MFYPYLILGASTYDIASQDKIACIKLSFCDRRSGGLHFDIAIYFVVYARLRQPRSDVPGRYLKIYINAIFSLIHLRTA